ncbi:Serine--tRNA ligase, mitochondrial [Friedmanniomyces endolithicus]|nr:Serine--tRNA ligase, mitochondrial [Friedmanniomyces endolithicus]
MKPSSFVCFACRQSARALHKQSYSHGAIKRSYTRPTFAPKPTLDLKHIRQNPGLYEQNCNDRNYGPYAGNGWKILELHEQLVLQQRQAVELRQRNNVLARELKKAATEADDGRDRAGLLQEARSLKGKLAEFEQREKLQEEMEILALELPNLSSLHTPVGEEPAVLGYINGDVVPTDSNGKSHIDIGAELDLLSFEASATTSGWGWYFLKNEAALLEQALIQYALSVALKRGWRVMTPPSLVYSHIASACGFMPRDQHGETQVYGIGQEEPAANGASLVLAGTAEIPFAGSQANRTLAETDLPLKVIGPSRCYRAEAGARGVDTKGLYRVHEFTKVEMFAWTVPPASSTSENEGFDTDDEQQQTQTEEVFDEMIAIQTEILTSLGLHARVLEMPTTDLGASATRKIDIEAWFPSRASIDNGYGEVTSASICTDYQARRLNTKIKLERGDVKSAFVHTVNGTALAVPRILACLLENGWEERTGTVEVPRCLRKWMPGELERIGASRRRVHAASGKRSSPGVGTSTSLRVCTTRGYTIHICTTSDSLPTNHKAMANLFGTLNRFISRLDSEPQAQQHSRSTTGYGFQILRNNNSGLALEPWFDFIIGLNGHNIDSPDQNLFTTEIQNCAGSTIGLGVYGAKGQQIREVYVTIPPRDTGAGLGLALQWAPLNLTDDVWHILDVMPNSPADVAGLLPYCDYVIGSPDGDVRADTGLGYLIEQYVEKPLRLYVYNHEYDVSRLLTITPSKHWGGDGALGCVLGYGALHRIPAPLTEPAQAPGETLFESATGQDQQTYHPASTPDPTSHPSSQQAPAPPAPPSNPADFLIPADMTFANPPPAPSVSPGPPQGRAKKARAHHAVAPAAGLDDYFAEGEKASREQDNAPTPKATSGLPPPPKGGGPPKAASPVLPPES